MSDLMQKPQENVEVKEVKGCGRLFKRLFLGSRLDEKLINEVLSGNTEGAKNAILQGANVNARDAMGTSALMLACDFSCFDIVSFLLSKKADVDLTNTLGITALHFAVQKNDIRVVRLLINNDDNKVNLRVNKKDERGNTPLHYAVDAGNIEAVDFLLQKKADKYAKNNEGYSPIDIARKKNFTKMVTLFYEFKSKSNV